VYRRWAYESGEHELTKRQFHESLRERGYQDGRGTGNKPVWLGIGLANGAKGWAA